MNKPLTFDTAIRVIQLRDMVDELAALKAQVAPIEHRMEWIKDQLKAADVPVNDKGTKYIDGTEHTAAIIPACRNVPAVDLLKEHFGATVFEDQWCYKSHSVSCKLTARKTR